MKKTKEACILLHKYTGQNIRGWLMSEKLDGVRSIWTGSELVSRKGLVFKAPEWFKAQLPADFKLDGELWMGRNTLQSLVGIVRSEAGDWSDVRYCVFDAPEAYGTLLERLSEASYQINKCLSKVAYTVEQKPCRSRAAELEFFNSIIAQGGEGTVIRNTEARYELRRSKNALKHKARESSEALTVGHIAGKNDAEIGSIAVVWHNVRFNIGLPKSLKLNPPDIGSLVTFAYSGLTEAGTPREASFVIERNYEGKRVFIPESIPQINLTCEVAIS